jgi:hypothetical protein
LNPPSLAGFFGMLLRAAAKTTEIEHECAC